MYFTDYLNNNAAGLVAKNEDLKKEAKAKIVIDPGKGMNTYTQLIARLSCMQF